MKYLKVCRICETTELYTIGLTDHLLEYLTIAQVRLCGIMSIKDDMQLGDQRSDKRSKFNE